MHSIIFPLLHYFFVLFNRLHGSNMFKCDKLLTHRRYRDLICGCQAYGAKRWDASLQRMCERFSFSMSLSNRPRHELEEGKHLLLFSGLYYYISQLDKYYNVQKLSKKWLSIFFLRLMIDSAEGRRNLMKLSHRMIKMFSEMLSMSSNLAFPNTSELNNSGIRVSLRQSDGLGQLNGLIVGAATSLWLPLSPEYLF